MRREDDRITSQKRYCFQCGANMQLDWMYCPYCGKKVDEGGAFSINGFDPDAYTVHENKTREVNHSESAHGYVPLGSPRKINGEHVDRPSGKKKRFSIVWLVILLWVLIGAVVGMLGSSGMDVLDKGIEYFTESSDNEDPSVDTDDVVVDDKSDDADSDDDTDDESSGNTTHKLTLKKSGD